jgi:hypothetical protein
MIKLLSDASFNGELLAQVFKRAPGADLLIADEVGFLGAEDPAILAWAAANDRVVITSDKKTMIGFAYARVRAHLKMPGLIHVDQSVAPKDVVNDLVYLIECGVPDDFQDQVIYIPI